MPEDTMPSQIGHCCMIPLMWKWKVKVKLLSRVRLFATPWTVAYRASLSMGFSRQEYWSGVPFPSPGDLPDPGIEARSPTLQADALTSEARPTIVIERASSTVVARGWGQRTRWCFSLEKNKTEVLEMDVGNNCKTMHRTLRNISH